MNSWVAAARDAAAASGRVDQSLRSTSASVCRRAVEQVADMNELELPPVSGRARLSRGFRAVFPGARSAPLRIADHHVLKCGARSEHDGATVSQARKI